MITGHIRKRKKKDGSASYQIILEMERDPITGKRQRSYTTVNGSRKEAEAEINRLKYEMRCGNCITKPSSLKLSSWLSEWMDKYNDNLSPTTKSGYRHQITKRINPYIGNAPISTLKCGHIQSWINTLAHQGLSGKTIKNSFLNVNSALEKAKDLGMIPQNPCVHVVLPTIKKYQAQVYTLREVKQTLALAKNTDMYFLLAIEFYLGLRKGEVAELKWSDVDLKEGLVHITRSRVECDEGIVIKSTKSEAGIRSIPLSDEMLKIFKNEYTKHLEDCKRKDFTNTDYVICKQSGEAYVPASIPQRWDRFRDSNNLKKIRFHDLRHTCATLMIANGIPAKTVQTWLGHADIQVTLNTYTHCLPSMKEDAGNKMNVIFK